MSEATIKTTKKLTVRNLVLCAMFVSLITIGAFIKIPLPYGDYFTLQTLFVLLAGLLLGSYKGALSVFVYVLLGLIGIPVFAGGSGIGYIFKPTFGYLIGFIVGAGITGFITHKLKNKSYIKLLFACFCGLAMIYGIGLIYKYFMLNCYLGTPMKGWTLFLLCFPIDIPCDIILCFFGAFLAKKLIPVIKI